MTTAELVKAGLGQVAGLLGETALEPDPERVDWLAARPALDKLQSLLQTGVLGPIAAAAPLAAGAELTAAAADATAATAAVVFASGDTRAADALFERAIGLAVNMKQKAGFAAARREPRLFTRLARAAWLEGRGRSGEAASERLAVASQAVDPALRDAAGARPAPPPPSPQSRPVGSAPSLFTLNGIGFRLYGARDRRPDGSKIATYFFTIFYVPIVPVRAYRVQQDGNSYWFQTIEPLSSLAVWYRRLILCGVIGLVAAGAFSSWRDSPGRKAGLAVAAAAKLEKAGDAAGAGKAYQAVLDDFPGAGSDILEDAALGLVRLALAEVKEPFSPAQLEAARRAVAAYDGLPSKVRTGPARQLLVDKLVAWAAVDEKADTAHVQASLGLIELGERVGGRSDLAGKRVELRRRLAASYEAEEPMAALALHLETPGDASARAAAVRLLKALADEPSLLLELEDPILVWAEKVGAAGEDAAGAVSAARARQDDPARAQLLEGGDAAALAKAVAAAPRDQELVCALAELERSAGDVASARKRVEALGPPGRLIGRARTLLAQIRRDEGDLAGAAQIVESWLAWRRPMFLAAATRYSDRRRKLGEQLEDEVDRGRHNDELEGLMKGKSEAEQQDAFMEWAGQRIDSDSELAALGRDVGRFADVTPAALLAGQLALERARTTSGAEAEALLAAAEQHYLSIQLVAGGSAEYHLGLGQVYYRLGRPAAGEKELAALLEDADAETRLEVAYVYRELGLESKALDLAVGVLDDDKVEKIMRANGASLAALLVDSRDERRKYLARASVLGHEGATINLLGEDAADLAREGKLKEADAKLAQVEKFHMKDAAVNPVSANNAALAAARRYAVTGDMARLDEAVRLLEESARHQGDNTIVINNLASVLLNRARLRALAPLVQLPLLHLEPPAAETLCDELMRGPDGESFRAALRRDPAVRRVLDLYRRAQLLAPQSPDGYISESNLLGDLRDAPGREALAARVGGLSGFAVDDWARMERQRADGELEDELRQDGDESVAHAERVLAELPASASRETRAAAELLVAQAYVQQSMVAGEPALRAAREHQDKAHALWPARIGESGTAALDVMIAVRAVADADAARQKRFARVARESGPWLAAWELAHDEAFLAALRARPELAGCAARVAELPLLTLETWIVARLLGDAALEKRAEADLAAPLLRSRFDIFARVLAGVPSADREVALYRERK